MHAALLKEKDEKIALLERMLGEKRSSGNYNDVMEAS